MPRASDTTAPLGERILYVLGAALLKLIHLTLRVRTEGEDPILALVAQGRPVLTASWHGRLMIGIGYARRYQPLVMISQSRDGERIAQVAQRLGFRPVRGSSSRGGVRALIELSRRLREGGFAIHLVDGPRGPAGEIQPGLIAAAQRSGAVIVPTYGSVRWRIESKSWDRHQIPLPFSPVLIHFSEPIEVPDKITDEEREALRKRIEAEMREGYARTDARV